MTAITNTDLTTLDEDGRGTFDEVMKAVELHLEKEFNGGRIQGAEYSKVYLGAISAAISQSIQFLLGRQAADKQADLLDQQGTNEALKGALIQCEIDKCQEQILAIRQDTANAVVEGDNLTKTGLGISANTLLTGKQDAKVVADTAQSTASKLLTDQQILIAAQGVLEAVQKVSIATNTVSKIAQDTATGIKQEENIAQDTLLKVQQTSKVVQDVTASQAAVSKIGLDGLLVTKQTLDVEQKTTNAVATKTIIDNTGLKVAQETSLLNQKTLTEEAQILDVVTGAIAVAGTIGKQKELYTAQTAGFARDAEQKAAKLQLDALGIRVSADPNAGTTPDSLANTEIDDILAKLKLGINA